MADPAYPIPAPLQNMNATDTATLDIEKPFQTILHVAHLRLANAISSLVTALDIFCFKHQQACMAVTRSEVSLNDHFFNHCLAPADVELQ
jgi:hypothetical protein